MINKTCLSTLLLILIFFTNIMAQESLTLDCGRFRLDVDDDGSYEYIYPADFNEEDHANTNGDITFMAENWTDPNGTYYESAWETEFFPYSSQKYLRYAPTNIVIDNVDITKSLSVLESVEPDLIADQMIEQTYLSSIGLKIIARTYGFSHEDYQDFALTHYLLINTGEADEFEGVDLPDQSLSNLYLILDRWRVWPDQHLAERHHPGVNSFFMDFYGDNPEDTLKIFYGWDGDDPTNGQYEDEGNPAYASDWEFLTPYYSGVGLVHADASVQDRSDDDSKISSVLRGANYDLSNWTEDQFYTYLTAQGNFPPEIDPDIPGIDPKNEQQPRMYMSIGPYDMAFGDTVNIVLFWGVGARSTQECREWGLKYKNGEITDEEKNQFLRWGKTDLMNKLSRARKLWKNNLQVPGGFNPVPPASITMESGPGYIDINWESVPGAENYNIYRALGVQDSVIYPLLSEGLENTTFRDEDVNRGFDYYYNITAIDANGQESSQYWARTSRKSAVPRTAQGASDLSDVRVVPNPFVYDKSAELNYPGQKDKIVFAGLPGPCKITIFTQSGDIVDEIDHDTIEGTHDWFQVTKYNQYIASGVYVYYVESKEGKGSTMGKFIIIR